MKSMYIAIILAVVACSVKHHEDKKADSLKEAEFWTKLELALHKASSN